MIKIIIIIINLTVNDHDSRNGNDEIQVQDKEESGVINMSSSSMTSMDLSKNKTDENFMPWYFPPISYAYNYPSPTRSIYEDTLVGECVS